MAANTGIARILSLLCWGCVLAGNAFGQNLILNNGFESVDFVEGQSLVPIIHAEVWGEHSKGEVNHTCGQPSRSGKFDAQIDLYNKREFLIGRMKCELIAGEQYRFEMYVQAAKNRYLTKCISIDFLDHAMLTNFLKANLFGNNKRSVSLSMNRVLKYDSVWHYYSDIFTASGGEMYLLIGNYCNEVSGKYFIDKRYIQNRGIAKRSRYKFDDLNLIPLSSFGNCAESVSENPKPDTIEISHLNFAFNSHHLSDTGIIRLQSMKDLLANAVSIEIYGYTDTSGSETYNQTLSTQRARAVFDALKAIGISDTIMQYSGMGKSYKYSEPHRNRRVEIVVGR